MWKIAVIDDDYATEIVVESLQNRSFEAYRVKSATDALSSLDKIIEADLVILDMIMARPTTESVPISGDMATGMTLFRAIRQRRADMPILVFTASRDTEIIAAVKSEKKADFLAKWATPSLRDILSKVEQLIGHSGPRMPKTFIVHGHDEVEKLALKNYVQNTLGFPEPIILHELPNMGRTLVEKFEDAASNIDLALVLLTPDDIIANSDFSNEEKRRARQNVIFEMGYFLGAFGRSSGRVILLHKGPLDIPSDLSGVIYIDISNGVFAAGENIRRELCHDR